MCKCPDIWSGDNNIKDIETYITGVQEFLDIFNSLFNPNVCKLRDNTQQTG